MVGVGLGIDVQLNQVFRWLRNFGLQILKKRSGVMLDIRWRLGNWVVNILGKVCLQGIFVEIGQGEYIINKGIVGNIFGGVKDQDRELENNGVG